jgi:YVTN family beta-propeller protein
VTGLHACALALSPNGKFLVVANAGSDTLSVIDTRTDKIVETICARQNPGDLFGAQPDALAFDKSGKNFLSATARRTPSRFSIQAGRIETARPDSRRLVSRRDCV